MPKLLTIADTKLPFGAWRVVILLFFVGCLNYLDRTMITTMRGSLMSAVHISNAQFGLLTAVFLLAYGLLSPFSGYLADRYSRSRVIVYSLLAWSAITLITGFATTFHQLLFTRVLLGITEAFYVPAAMALLMDYHKGNTRSTVSGINISGIMLGQSLGFLGGWIAERNGWNTSFWLFGTIGLIYGTLLLFLLKDAPHHGEKTAEIQPVKVKFPNAVLSLFSQRAYCFLLLLWSIMGVIAWMVIGWMPAFYQEHFSLSQAVAGFYATACLYPGSIIGLLLGGYLADRWGKSNPRARVYLPIIGFAIAIPAIFIATNTTLVAITISMFMVYAVTRNFCDANITPLLCLSADGRFTATGFGILNLFACVAGGIGIYGGGLLRDRHVAFSSIFQSVALLLVIGIGLLFLIKGQLFDKKKPV